jgi:energy-coupling factor transporter ATP-binding protein EcfA2
VAVARALVSEPTVLFADEPTGNLDSRSSAEVIDLLREASGVYGQTIVMVTHDPVAAEAADRTVHIEDGRCGGDLMTRVGLRGITTRRLRTVLTALAIVLGVAMVSGAYTLTDTMKGAADSLSSSAYDGTAAVVSPRPWSRWTPIIRPPGHSSDTLDQVRAVPGVEQAVGSITDEARIVGKDGDVVGTGPYFGVGLDRRPATSPPSS